MYSMYADDSHNTPSYTHISLVRMWYKESTPCMVANPTHLSIFFVAWCLGS